VQEDTLRLLQWELLTRHVAQFANTEAGKRYCSQLQPALHQHQAQYGLTETQEALLLETKLAQGLPFGGVRDIQARIEHSQVGGLLEGLELLDLASTLAAARKIRRVIEEQESGVENLKDLVQTMRTFTDLEQRISYCLDDDGEVLDRASPTLAEARTQQRRLRDKIHRTLQALLQRHPAYFQEQQIGRAHV